MAHSEMHKMHRYAEEDAKTIVAALNAVDSSVKQTDFRTDESNRNDAETLKCSLDVSYGDGKSMTVDWEYTSTADSDYVFISEDVEELKKRAIKKLKSSVNSSTRVRKKRPIRAADDDFAEFDEEGVDEELLEEDDDSLADTIDGIADDVEDIQDAVEDFEEEDPDIGMDNNIDGHYIAECERCQQVFISAVIESDQEVSKISGVCPLCGKESDQYLKWVIKAVEE